MEMWFHIHYIFDNPTTKTDQRMRATVSGNGTNTFCILSSRTHKNSHMLGAMWKWNKAVIRPTRMALQGAWRKREKQQAPFIDSNRVDYFEWELRALTEWR